MSDSDRRNEFLKAVQKLHVELDMLTESYDMKGTAVNIMLTGVIDYDDFGEPVLKAVFTLDVDNDQTLSEALDFLLFSYSTHDDEYDDESEEYESENWWKDLFDDLDSPENLN
jgi:hypothetical protein|tara:strand:- start:865 stop:1203 length:339 start_codon:yes stop_codon:yes gene_type:complete